MIYGSQEFAERLKSILKDGYRHPLYYKTVEHAKAMGVHIYGDKPMYLLERSRPREDEDVTTYRIENYEPTTKAGADKAIDIVCKIFNPTLYSINWPNQSTQSKELQQYTLEYYPVFNSLPVYDKDVLIRKMLADPNGVVAVKPQQMPENDAEKLKPISVLYGSSSIYDYDLDHFLIYISEETVDNICYYYFSYFDKNQYLYIRAWYEESKKQIYVTEIEKYAYNFNEIPVWFLRGKSKSEDNGEIYYESYFSSALPHWNLAVIHESDLLGAYINHMHPQKYELAEECNHQFTLDSLTFKCMGGHMKTVGGIAHSLVGSECPKCGGGGLTSVKSPYAAYQFNRKKLEEGQPVPFLPVGYIQLETEATKMLQERCESMNKKALWSINMDVEDEVGANQSGVAKVIDRSAQYDTLFNMGSVVFDVHLTNQFYFINKFMFSIQAQSLNKKEDKNLPNINKPTMFDVLTTAELVNNFSIAQKSGVDKNYLRVKAIEIANRDLSTSPEVRLYTVTMLNIDPLYGFTQDEISLGVNQGVIRKVDWALHENLKPLMDKAVKEKNGFLQLQKEDQLVILEAYAEELISSEKPRVDERFMQMHPVDDAA